MNTLESSPIGDQSTLQRYINRRAVARMLGVSTRTVDNLVRQGCPHIKLGYRSVRFEPDQVATWLRDHRGIRHSSTVSTTEGGAP
ncbi:MAG TPA: helix-turn-helix domain-containing protein [Candidatus Limnocylindria bacterium]|jgi:excisionase family DNA binding protein|nr:helix-turn-helix domain-containing protein [Candidatus Limnocylindria bacterium]